MQQSFTIDGIEFLIDTRAGKDRGVSEGNRFILVKSQQCLDFYRNWQGKTPKTIMEVGLFQGGSFVLLDKLFHPERLVGVDIRRGPIQPLEDYRAGKPHIDVYYGRSQDRPGTLTAARKNFPDGIDLVIDDASHLYEQTRATFQMLFPMVRPGGYYVIEDWAWSLRQPYQKESHSWFNKPAMTNLILELTMLAGFHRSIERVEVLRDLVVVHRGTGPFPQEAFNLEPVLRGRSFPQI